MRTFSHNIFLLMFTLMFAIWTPSLTAATSAPAQKTTQPVLDNHQVLIQKKLRALLDNTLNKAGEAPIHNVTLLVESPTKNFKFKGAAGLADGKRVAMTADHTYKIASQTKTFTAVVIMQLVEEAQLSLDDKLDKFFADDKVVNLDKLHIHKGTSSGRKITVKHLLAHTSGLKHYFYDANKRFLAYFLENPWIQWNPANILAKYFEYELNTQAEFAPGEGFYYSDTNYLLLGMIIEKITGSTLHAQFKSRLFDKLGMNNTYLEFYEARRGTRPFSHPFYGEMNASHGNTSFDWGGGGLVSNNEELSVFIKALFKGELFQNNSTLNQMLDGNQASMGGKSSYGFGISIIKMDGEVLKGHRGVYGSMMFYDAKKDIIICASLNQVKAHNNVFKFLKNLLHIIKDL